MSAVMQLSCHLREKLLLEECSFASQTMPLSQIQDSLSTSISTCSSGVLQPWSTTLKNIAVTSASEIMSSIGLTASSNIGTNSVQYSSSSASDSIFKVPYEPPKVSTSFSMSQVHSERVKTSENIINSSSLTDLQSSSTLNQAFDNPVSSEINNTGQSTSNISILKSPNSQSQLCFDSTGPTYTINADGRLYSASIDFPPSKKHCRSVSDSDATAEFHPSSFLSSPSLSWTPGYHSRVWVPSKSFLSNSCFTGSKVSESRSNLQNNPASGYAQNFPLMDTPPKLPSIPQPASVVIPQSSPQNAGSELAAFSPQSFAGREQDANFQSYVSPAISSLSPRRSQDAMPSHASLAATKRALSFSNDFEYRESVEYKPFFTPECKRRSSQSNLCGGLSRCQSHPADLNVKRGKSRRRAKFSHNRPSLDFMKMKQSSFSKLSRYKERTRSSISKIFEPIPMISVPNSLKSANKNEDLMFVDRRFSPPGNDDTLEQVERMSSVAEDNFVRDCLDLDVNEIENEDEMA